MTGFTLSWSFRLGLAACAAALLVLNWAVRREPAGGGPDPGPTAVDAGGGAEAIGNDASDPTADPLLVNEGWQIRNMATAQGTFVIEVEADDPSRTGTIARTLIEPIKADYDEILVYVSKSDDDSDLPARRVQWTPRDGYVELTYDPPPSDR